MEKICEFCMALRPVVYCKADAAYLCLSCDAKVHSANALFNQHLRALLCDSCRYHPAYAQCLDHRMLMCRGCDRSLHGVSSQHQKQAISTYVGCPSAKDFAALWCFEFGELDKSAVQDQLFSTLHDSVQASMPYLDIPRESCLQTGCSSVISKVGCSTLVSGAESGVGSTSLQPEISYKGWQQQNTCFILEQILDLNRLQLTDLNGLAMHDQEQKSIYSSTIITSKKLDNNLDHLPHSQNLVTAHQQYDCPLQGLKVDSLPLPFSQPAHLQSFSTAANAFLGESFCQCKSPVQSSQLWCQNMQDLGVCEDNICHDDLNIPDVDTTFHNFEDLFGSDQDQIRALFDDSEVSCSSVEKEAPPEKSNSSNARAREDTSIASFVCMSQSVHMGQDNGSASQAYDSPGDLDSPLSSQPSYSTMSLSISRLIAESSGTEYLDSGLSPNITKGKASCHSPDLEGAHSEARESAMMRYKEKKKARLHEKQIQYASRKPRSDMQKRGKG